MTPAELDIVRELRALGAVRVQIGTVCVEFGPLVVAQSTQAISAQAALSREDQYIVDAIRSAGGN